MEFLKKLFKKLDLIIGIIGAIIAAIGFVSIKNKIKSKKDDNSKVKDDEIKPGTTVVKPDKMKDRSKNPIRDKYVIVTKDGEKIDSPIPDEKVKEVIRNEMEAKDFEEKHEKLSNNLLDKIRKYKKKKEEEK